MVRKLAIVALCAAAHSAVAQSTIIAQWNFNVADAAITVGALLFIVDTLFTRHDVPQAV